MTAMDMTAAQQLSENQFIREAKQAMDQLQNPDLQSKARELRVVGGLMMSESEPSSDYFEADVMKHVKARAGWIVSLSLLGILSGMIIAGYEDALGALLILAIYMPVMADTGGNVGSQSAVLIVRCLATGEIRFNQWKSLLWKEIRISMIMAAILMTVVMLRVVTFGTGATLPAGITLNLIGVAVAVAMAIQVVTSTVIGSMRLDPAVLVSPVLTSIVDVSGMWIYFTITTAVLGL